MINKLSPKIIDDPHYKHFQPILNASETISENSRGARAITERYFFPFFYYISLTR